jgi:diadenosine tetraphosphate (Ap4A) HIT family hydrolase
MTLHPNLLKKDFVIDLPLCKVLFEDDKYYPWIFLVPQHNNISKIMDLSPKDQLQLIKELDIAQNVMWELFKPDQINVAAIGNKTPQLHIHIIARYNEDPAWPGTVWDHPEHAQYPLEQKQEIITKIKQEFIAKTGVITTSP